MENSKINYTKGQLKKIKEFIDKVYENVQDKRIASLIADYIKSYYENFELGERLLERSTRALGLLLNADGILQLNTEKISWHTYCKLMKWINDQKGTINDLSIYQYERNHV